MEQLESAAERAAANRKRIVAGWITVGSSGTKHTHKTTPQTQNQPKPNRAERLGLGAKPDKNRQTTVANNVFAGLAAKKKLTEGTGQGQGQGNKYGKRPLTIAADSDDEDSRAKSVGRKK